MPRSSPGASARAVRLLTGLLLAVAAMVVVQAPARAAANLDCSSVYALQQADPRSIWALDLATGGQTSVGGFSGLAGGGINALGISANGSQAYGVLAAAGSGTGRTIYQHTRSSDDVVSLGAGVSGAITTHGAVNPKTGHFYYGGFSGGELEVYGFNTQTHTSMGLVAKGAVPTGGGNGDWVFDKRGRLYVVGGADGVNKISVVDQAIPTSGPAITITGSEMASIDTEASANLNGIAFAGSGYLYVSSSSRLFKVNPSSGAQVESHPLSLSTSVDLASCASPTTITVQGSFPDGRVSPADQTTVSVSGGGIEAGTTGTTSGTESGGQSDPAEQAGPVFGLAGQEYTVTQTGPGTQSPEYRTTWECRDENDGSLIDSGEGTSGTFVMPGAGADGVAAMCTFSNEAQVPGVSLDKRAELGGSSAGDEVSYDYLVTNTGTTDLATVSVLDDQVGPVTCPAGRLSRGASLTCTTAPYSLTQADVDRGSVGGPATVTAVPVLTGLPVAEASDTETTTVPRTDELALEVEAEPAVDVDEDGLVDAGDAVAFRYALTNTGNTSLTSVTVDDPTAGPVSCPATSLAPGESVTCTTEPAHTVTAQDEQAGEVVAAPDGRATGPAGIQISAPPASARVAVTAEQRRLVLGSSVVTDDVNDDGLVDAGDRITYRYTLTNPGNVTLRDLALASDLLGVVACEVTTLAPGAHTDCPPMSHVVTEDDEQAGTVAATASASATGPLGRAVAAEPVVSTTATTVPSPSLTVARHAVVPLDVNESRRTDAGDTVRYGYTVRNDGNVPVSGVGVVGSRAGSVLCSQSAVAVGESVECIAEEPYTIDADDERAGSIVDTVHAEGVDPDGDQVVSSEVSSTVLVPIPRVGLEKRPGDLSGHRAGGTIIYDYVVTNTGSTPLASVVVDDPQVGTVTCPDLPLAVGASVTCTAPAYHLTQADVDRGTVGGVAVATGVPVLDGIGLASATDDATTPVERAGALTVAVTVGARVDVDGDGLVDAGDTVAFGYLVTNTGNTTLDAVSVADPAVGPVSCPTGFIAPGGSMSCATTAPYVVAALDEVRGEVVAVARASATSPEGAVESDEDTATVETGVEAPALVVTHTASVRDVNRSGLTDARDEISYVVTVTNQGNVPLRPVTVTSSVLGPVGCDDEALAPGASTGCRPASYRVSNDDVRGGAVRSTVVADAGGPRGPTVTAAPHTVVTDLTEPAPGLAITALDPVRDDVNGSGDVEAGDRLTYRYSVTNTGNVPLSGVTARGSVAGAVSCDETRLEPGGETACAADSTYLVTGADEVAGVVTDLVHARGVDPDEHEVRSPTGTTLVPVLLPRPELTLVTVPGLLDADGDGAADEGEHIRFTYTVTNTGNVAITEIAVADVTVGGITCAVTSLRPGESTTCTADAPYVVTAEDVRRGSVVSSATVTGLALGAGGSVESVATLEQEVEVVTDEPTPDPVEGPSAPVPSVPSVAGGVLPDTGGPRAGLLVTGLLSLVGGLGLLVSRRRRPARR